jgi:hypothetical protein
LVDGSLATPVQSSHSLLNVQGVQELKRSAGDGSERRNGFTVVTGQLRISLLDPVSDVTDINSGVFEAAYRSSQFRVGHGCKFRHRIILSYAVGGLIALTLPL